jgi:hypothetical protein
MLIEQKEDDAPRELDPRLKGKFELVGLKPGKIFFMMQDFDFRSMSVETASALVEKGCVYIRKIEDAGQSASKAGDKKTNNPKPQEERNRK